MDLTSLTAWFLMYKYPAILFFTIVEGPVIMVLSGLMLKLNIVSFWPVYTILIIGDLIGDIFWYSLGYYFAEPITNKYGHYIGLSKDVIKNLQGKFRYHEGKILFLSKITMGLGFALAVLVTAGMAKVPFKKYLTINFFGQFVWTGFLLLVGYFFGNIYSKVQKDMRIVFLVVLVIATFFVLKQISSYFKNRNFKNKSTDVVL